MTMIGVYACLVECSICGHVVETERTRIHIAPWGDMACEVCQRYTRIGFMVQGDLLYMAPSRVR